MSLLNLAGRHIDDFLLILGVGTGGTVILSDIESGLRIVLILVSIISFSLNIMILYKKNKKEVNEIKKDIDKNC